MAATERLVLDGSVTLAWFFKDEADPYADAIAGLFPNVEAWVAGIWPLEVANSLLVGERRKRSTQAEAQKWLFYLQSLGINVDGETTARAFNADFRGKKVGDISLDVSAFSSEISRSQPGFVTLFSLILPDLRLAISSSPD
jgi:hypothetical protein